MDGRTTRQPIAGDHVSRCPAGIFGIQLLAQRRAKAAQWASATPLGNLAPNTGAFAVGRCATTTPANTREGTGQASARRRWLPRTAQCLRSCVWSPIHGRDAYELHGHLRRRRMARRTIDRVAGNVAVRLQPRRRTCGTPRTITGTFTTVQPCSFTSPVVAGTSPAARPSMET